MINYKEIIQGTPKWFELRFGKIGGSESKGLYIDSNTLTVTKLGERCEEYTEEDGFTNIAMDRGNDLEPFAREYLSKYTGYDFQETGWLQSERNELLGISPDGITEDEKVSCEIKCLGRKAHYDILVNNEMPKDKIAQCLHYFTVNPKLEKHYFIAYRPEAPKQFIFEFTRDTVLDMGLKVEIKVEVISEKTGKILAPKIVKQADLRTVNDWVEYSHEKADELLKTVIEMENNIKF